MRKTSIEKILTASVNSQQILIFKKEKYTYCKWYVNDTAMVIIIKLRLINEYSSNKHSISNNSKKHELQ